jgi:hypothetical protein
MPANTGRTLNIGMVGIGDVITFLSTDFFSYRGVNNCAIYGFNYWQAPGNGWGSGSNTLSNPNTLKSWSLPDQNGKITPTRKDDITDTNPQTGSGLSYGIAASSMVANGTLSTPATGNSVRGVAWVIGGVESSSRLESNATFLTLDTIQSSEPPGSFIAYNYNIKLRNNNIGPGAMFIGDTPSKRLMWYCEHVGIATQSVPTSSPSYLRDTFTGPGPNGSLFTQSTYTVGSIPTGWVDSNAAAAATVDTGLIQYDPNQNDQGRGNGGGSGAFTGLPTIY